VSVHDLLWLFLPVAAAGGWFAAIRHQSGHKQAVWKHSQHFHKELNQLLSEKESAAELFDSFTHAERDAADTHIALGNLYRRRGEIDRAIMVHESLAKQASEKDISEAARFELARDYDSAGLLDRAETIFRQLTQSTTRQSEAYSALLQLHEREHDWAKAIETALECERETQRTLGERLAHYHCEQAQLAQSANRSLDAQEALQRALHHSPNSARARIALAAIAVEEKQFERAIRLYDEVETLQPELMPEIIRSRFDALLGAGDMQALNAFIMRIQAQRNAYSVVRTTRQIIAQIHDERVADRFFKDQILRRPSLKGLRDWAHDQLLLSKPGERDNVQVICNLLDQVMEDKPAYRCSSCGFEGNVMHWRCPSCESWDTVSTIIGVEGE